MKHLNLVKKISKVDEKAAEHIEALWNKKGKFLPVIIMSTQGDLNQAFLVGLNDALKREDSVKFAVRYFKDWTRKKFKKTVDISLSGYSADTPYYNGSAWAAIPSGEDPVVPPIDPEEPETPVEPEIPVEPEEPTDGTFTIYFENNWSWTGASIYYWGSTTATNPAWPGIALTEKVGKSADNHDIYKIVIPSDITGMIFNGTGGYGFEQSADITDIKNGYCYYMTYDGVTNTKPCGSYEYKA